MNTVSVFRVEHSKLGHGPWMALGRGNLSEITIDEANKLMHAKHAMDEYWTLNLDRYPCPQRDGLKNIFIENTHFCATKTLTELRKWFRVTAGYIDALFDAGFTVMEYVVPADDVLEGATQVAFGKANVIKAIDHTLLALFK